MIKMNVRRAFAFNFSVKHYQVRERQRPALKPAFVLEGERRYALEASLGAFTTSVPSLRSAIAISGLPQRLNQARIVDGFTKDMIMNEPEYIAAYQKIADKYENNQTSMEEYLEAIRKLKETFLKGKTGAALPVVP
jgi:hypothetical protein